MYFPEDDEIITVEEAEEFIAKKRVEAREEHRLLKELQARKAARSEKKAQESSALSAAASASSAAGVPGTKTLEREAASPRAAVAKEIITLIPDSYRDKIGRAAFKTLFGAALELSVFLTDPLVTPSNANFNMSLQKAFHAMGLLNAALTADPKKIEEIGKRLEDAKVSMEEFNQALGERLSKASLSAIFDGEALKKLTNKEAIAFAMNTKVVQRALTEGLAKLEEDVAGVLKQADKDSTKDTATVPTDPTSKKDDKSAPAVLTAATSTKAYKDPGDDPAYNKARHQWNFFQTDLLLRVKEGETSNPQLDALKTNFKTTWNNVKAKSLGDQVAALRDALIASGIFLTEADFKNIFVDSTTNTINGALFDETASAHEDVWSKVLFSLLRNSIHGWQAEKETGKSDRKEMPLVGTNANLSTTQEISGLASRVDDMIRESRKEKKPRSEWTVLLNSNGKYPDGTEDKRTFSEVLSTLGAERKTQDNHRDFVVANFYHMQENQTLKGYASSQALLSKYGMNPPRITRLSIQNSLKRGGLEYQNTSVKPPLRLKLTGSPFSLQELMAAMNQAADKKTLKGFDKAEVDADEVDVNGKNNPFYDLTFTVGSKQYVLAARIVGNTLHMQKQEITTDKATGARIKVGVASTLTDNDLNNGAVASGAALRDAIPNAIEKFIKCYNFDTKRDVDSDAADTVVTGGPDTLILALDHPLKVKAAAAVVAAPVPAFVDNRLLMRELDNLRAYRAYRVTALLLAKLESIGAATDIQKVCEDWNAELANIDKSYADLNLTGQVSLPTTAPFPAGNNEALETIINQLRAMVGPTAVPTNALLLQDYTKIQAIIAAYNTLPAPRTCVSFQKALANHHLDKVSTREAWEFYEAAYRNKTAAGADRERLAGLTRSDTEGTFYKTISLNEEDNMWLGLSDYMNKNVDKDINAATDPKEPIMTFDSKELYLDILPDAEKPAGAAGLHFYQLMEKKMVVEGGAKVGKLVPAEFSSKGEKARAITQLTTTLQERVDQIHISDGADASSIILLEHDVTLVDVSDGKGGTKKEEKFHINTKKHEPPPVVPSAPAPSPSPSPSPS